VTIGHQVVAFLASHQDGVPPLEGSALVFDSSTAMRQEFALLWDNLSADGVEARTIHATLGDAAVATPPQALDAQAETLGSYLNIVARSFDRRHELLEFVENLSGGNMRAALGFINTLVRSGHVNTRKILDIESGLMSTLYLSTSSSER
jgi:hypothetical protein